MKDIGLTHIALQVTDLQKSFEFYSKYARMEIDHKRKGVLWISDKTRPFVIVMFENETVTNPLIPDSHIGIGVKSKTEVDRLCKLANEKKCLISKPKDSGYPVGYWAYLKDPDNHTLEISYGQEVGLTVKENIQSNFNESTGE